MKANMVEAINKGLYEAMEADDRVVVLGEDVAQTGGVFRVTAGLKDRFGEARVVDTPLAEAGIIGSSVGMAMYGLLPVAEMQFDAFTYPGFEQIVTHAARLAWRTKGEVPASIVIRIPYGGGVRMPELHSDSPEALFVHVPGLKVVCPSTPEDARVMIIAAVEDPDPVIFMEPKKIYRASRDEIPDEPPFAIGNGNGSYNEYLSKARVARQGSDLAIFSYGATVPLCIQAAERLTRERNADPLVIDLRSLFPLDIKTIESAARGCGRALVVHEAPRTAGIGAEVSALIHERCMLDLEAPVGRVTGYDVPFPQFANEDDYLPSVDRIVAGANKVLDF